jgi:uncharacterized membrane protein YqgA involved in biofilm formation
MRGTVVNVVAILAGSGIGLLVGSRLPERLHRIITGGLGLCTLLIGLQMALKTQNVLLVIASMVVGGLVGELLGVEAALEAVGERLRRWAYGKSVAGQERTPEAATFVAGFVTASLVFCVGPMTILGSIQEGLTGNADILYTKSMLDGAASVAFASGLGAGVVGSILTVIVVQGSLTLLGGQLDFLLLPEILAEFTATGGLLIVAIGLLLLEVKRLPVANYLPALVVAILLAGARRLLGW